MCKLLILFRLEAMISLKSASNSREAMSDCGTCAMRAAYVVHVCEHATLFVVRCG